MNQIKSCLVFYLAFISDDSADILSALMDLTIDRALMDLTIHREVEFNIIVFDQCNCK